MPVDQDFEGPEPSALFGRTFGTTHGPDVPARPWSIDHGHGRIGRVGLGSGPKNHKERTVTDHTDHPGPIDDDGYCELHGWKTIGHVSTGNGLIAFVPPYYARSLADWWDERMPSFSAELSNFHQIGLHQITIKASKPDGYPDSETAFVVACENGVYDVEARFDDAYGGDEHMSICELRIKLHLHLEEDEEREWTHIPDHEQHFPCPEEEWHRVVDELRRQP
jgi:hypothetical protein